MCFLCFRTATAGYYKSAVGVVVLYDVTRVRSFENAARWIDHARDLLGPASPPILLLGNKLDLRHNRSVATEEGHNLAKSKKTFFFEISAKDATNVQKAFQLLINQIEEKLAQEELKSDVKQENGLEQGSKSLGQTKSMKCDPLTVVQKQPKSKFSLRDSTQHCIDAAKESCCPNFTCF